MRGHPQEGRRWGETWVWCAHFFSRAPLECSRARATVCASHCGRGLCKPTHGGVSTDPGRKLESTDVAVRSSCMSGQVPGTVRALKGWRGNHPPTCGYARIGSHDSSDHAAASDAIDAFSCSSCTRASWRDCRYVDSDRFA